MTSKPRLTIATGPLLPVPAVAGGSVHRMWELLAPHFVTAGWQVTVAARAWPGQPAQEQIEGVDYLRWGGFDHGAVLAFNVLRDLRYAAGLRSRLPDADVLVVNDVMLPLLARRSSGRMLVSVNRFPKGQLRLWRRAACLVAPSAAIAQAIISQAPAMRDRILQIPNAFPMADFDCDAESPRRPHTVLYVGRLHPEKGVHTLLAAARYLHESGQALHLTLVGPHETAMGGGGPEYLARLREHAQGLQVNFVGPVYRREQLAQLYREHSVFCYPSAAETGEASPIAPLEAMAAGCVPVVANLQCYAGMLSNGENSLNFDYRGAQPELKLAAALQRLFLEPTTQQRLARQARKDARLYDTAQVARRWLDAFAVRLSA